MGDNKENRGIGLQLLLKPHASLEIEMVGGLVKEEQVRSQEERPGQGNSHSPAAGEVLALLVLHRRRELKSHQQMCCSRLSCISSKIVETFIHLM